MSIKLSEISIKSASKVFEFLNILLENESLNPKYFRDNINNFSIGEKYFIYVYALEYFKLHTREEKELKNYKESFLELWIKDTDYQYGTNETSDYLSIIIKNAEEILKIVNSSSIDLLKKEFESTVELADKKSKNLFSIEKPLPFFDFEDKEYKIYKKIPLNVDVEHKEKFKSIFFEILTKCMDYQSVEQFYNNSFEELIELKLLNIHVESKTLLDNCIKKVIKNYKDYISDHTKENGYYDKINNSLNERLSSSSSLRKKFLPKKLKYQKITRYHFMIAMYNAFPHIREGYKSAQKKNPSKSTKSFLSERMKNI